MGLSSVFVESIVVGTEHALALTSTGDVYGWGNNTELQLGLGRSTEAVVQPMLIRSLCNKNIKQVRCDYFL